MPDELLPLRGRSVRWNSDTNGGRVCSLQSRAASRDLVARRDIVEISRDLELSRELDAGRDCALSAGAARRAVAKTQPTATAAVQSPDKPTTFPDPPPSSPRTGSGNQLPVPRWRTSEAAGRGE